MVKIDLLAVLFYCFW